MATTKEKQRKGFMSMAFYKSSSKRSTHHKPKPEPTPAVIDTIINNKPMSPNLLLMQKLESFQEMEQLGGSSGGGGGGGGSGRRKIEGRGGGGGGRELVVEAGRKSVSHVETNLASVAAFLQVKVLVSDMPGFMQVHAFRCARRTYDSLDKFSSKHMAYNMKKEFDKVYGPAWHCIVGSSFGSFVTHSTGCFLYFSMEKLYILVFKTKVQRALA